MGNVSFQKEMKQIESLGPLTERMEVKRPRLGSLESSKFVRRFSISLKQTILFYTLNKEKNIKFAQTRKKSI